MVDLGFRSTSGVRVSVLREGRFYLVVLDPKTHTCPESVENTIAVFYGATIKDAVCRASCGALKKLEQEKGFNYEGVNNVEFVRKGKAGGWADHFSSEDRDLFDRYHGGPIPELGYEW